MKNKYMTKQTEYNKIIDALNLIDEIAERADSYTHEDKARGKAYKLVADFIDKNAKR
jgi:hypothetical protein